MKKLLLFLAPAMLAVGCAEKIDFPIPAEEPAESVTRAAIAPRARSLDGAIYNEVADVWMIPRKDPFALSNVQALYDARTDGKARSGQTLSPTHYALKIYPRDEKEQWRVERMEDVQVAYIPFDYAQLTAEEVKRVAQLPTRSQATFAKRSPYTVTYDYTDVTDGGPTGPVTYQLPILYTVWPVDKPLPDDLDYVVDYEVLLPAQTGGESVVTRTNISTTYYATGKLEAYDNVLNCNVPMGNLQAQVQYGSYILSGYTGSNGMLTLSSLTIDNDPYGMIDYDFGPGGVYVELTVTYHDPAGKWSIKQGNTTIPCTAALSIEMFSPESEMEDPSYYYSYENPPLPESNYQANEIHRAANYFFYGQNIFLRPNISGGIKIHAHSTTSIYEGLFSYSLSYSFYPRIDIYNNNRNHSHVIGTTLHELGHFAHYWNGSSGVYADYFIKTHVGLQEAFSTYAGWYLGESYYTSLGWTRPSASSYYPNGDITGDSRQYWVKTIAIGGQYMPLFVDLTDNYNQRIYYSSLTPKDVIIGVPPSVIWNIAISSRYWSECLPQLENLIGTYYTTTQFNDWVEDFNYWFLNN